MENMDMRFIALLVVLAVHCECVNIGNGETYTVEVSKDVKMKYHHFVSWRYISKQGDKLNDMYRSEKLSAKSCLKICHQTANCVGVNYCERRHNCHLDGDSADIARHTQTSTYSRCILLSAGLHPGENPDDSAKQDNQWAHYYHQLSVEDYEVDEE